MNCEYCDADIDEGFEFCDDECEDRFNTREARF